VQGAAHIIPLLIKAGCNASIPDDRGFTPVEVALLRRDCDTSYALYCAGALFTNRQLLFLAILLRHSSLLRHVDFLAILHEFLYFSAVLLETNISASSASLTLPCSASPCSLYASKVDFNSCLRTEDLSQKERRDDAVAWLE
jgi:hypothetical protein